MIGSNHIPSQSAIRNASGLVSPKSGTPHLPDSDDSTDDIDCIAPTREVPKAVHPGHGKMSFSPR